jgi:hypothetical protein
MLAGCTVQEPDTCSSPVFGGSSVALLPASPLPVLGSASAGCRLASLLLVALASCSGAHVEQQYSLDTPAATMLTSYVIGGQSERQCWYYASLEAVCIVQGACNKQQRKAKPRPLMQMFAGT